MENGPQPGVILKRPSPRTPMKRKSFLKLSPEQTERAALASTYVGSPEHKLPGARSDATLCPKDLTDAQSMVTSWLRASIRSGFVGGLLEGIFPRYVWYQSEDCFFEGRLTNQTQGEYKGYPINIDELPQEMLDSHG